MAREEERCRSCRQPIWWVWMPSGKRMPVDRAPAPAGTVRIWQAGDRLAGDVVPAARRASCDEPLYLSHFATCPAAWAYRRARTTTREGERR